MDTIPLPWQFGTLAVLLFISAFFSIAETSLLSLNRYRLRHLVGSGHRGARLASLLLAKIDQLLGVILLGNIAANAAAAVLATVISAELLGQGDWALLAATIAATLAILVFSEVSPKVIAAAHPEKLGFMVSYILYPLVKIAYPAVWFVNLFVNGLLRLLGLKVKFAESPHAISMEELRTIVTEAGNFIPKKHRSILLNLFDLEDSTVDDVMTAHTQIELLDFDLPLEDILQHISTSHHTRLPVRRGPEDEIIGFIHVRRVINQIRHGDLSMASLEAVISEPYFIPSGTPLYTQMQQFQEHQQRMALVVDEYGELKGLVTLEDILEEIIGDFTTQSPLHNGKYRLEKDGSWLVDGSSSLRDLNRKLGLDLPLEGPRTLNGLVLEHFEDIPEPSTSFKIGKHALEVVQTQDRIVKSVRIYP